MGVNFIGRGPGSGAGDGYGDGFGCGNGNGNRKAGASKRPPVLTIFFVQYEKTKNYYI